MALGRSIETNDRPNGKFDAPLNFCSKSMILIYFM